jgi:hypothetical protein
VSLPKDVAKYHKGLLQNDRVICQTLFGIIDDSLTKAEVKVWHGHPVWFLNGNPIVGYSKKKAGIELLFWSGQTFDVEELVSIGKFKAAGITFTELIEVKKTKIKSWVQKSKKIQWDYSNLPKNRKLVKLTEF